MTWEPETPACLPYPVAVFYPTADRRGPKANPTEEEYDDARAICDLCLDRGPCLEYALATREPDGMWGAMTPKERRRILATRSSDGMTAQAFTSHRAAEIAGVSYRQVDYWARTGLVRPSLSVAHGSGSRRRWHHRDLVALSVVAALLAAGVELPTIRNAMSDLGPEVGQAGFLVVTPGEVVVALDSDRLDEVLPDGTNAATVVSLAAVRRTVASRLAA